MAYDLLIRNGRVMDGSGSPAFAADVGIRNGKIAEIGRLRGAARRTIDAQGRVVAPGFIDSHTHFDAQVTWDPLCTWSCYNGVTTVIMGNCSLGMAPTRPGTGERVAEFLSYVEAIPLDTLKTVDVRWESFGEFLDTIDKRLGMNVGALVGHTPVRHYVMREESQARDPTAHEIAQMRAIVKEAMEAGALGLSFSLNIGHYDSKGVRIPSAWAKEEEIFALSEVLAELGMGVVQAGSGSGPELKTRLMSRLSERTGRPVIYSQLQHALRKPDEWKRLMEITDESVKNGIRVYPSSSPALSYADFTMRNCQIFKGVPAWHEVQLAADEEKLEAYRDREFRKQVHYALIEWPPEIQGCTMRYQLSLGRNWPDTVQVKQVKLDKNKKYEGMSLREMAQVQGKGIIDGFLDLVVEEGLDTGFIQGRRGFDVPAMSQILNYPQAPIGLSDAGAHVQFRGGYGFAAMLLGYWVRKHKVMSVETAVKKLTFDIAQFFGIYDRGLLHPGMAADIVIFDPDTISVRPEEKVFDLPGGGWRYKELADGIFCTVVNGEVFVENGEHTGAYPGRVLRNSLYIEKAAESDCDCLRTANLEWSDMERNNKDTAVLFGVGDVGPIHKPIEPYSELVRDTLATGDIRFAQCERIYSQRGTLAHHRRGVDHSRAHPDCASVISDCKFDVVSVAGNHGLDFGPEGLLDTIEVVKDRGAQPIGAGKNLEEACKPAFFERNGVRIAFLAYCSVLEKGFEAGAKRAGIAPLRAHTYYEPYETQPGMPPRIVTIAFEEDVEAMAGHIKAAKREAHCVVVSFHWGVHQIPRMIADYQPVVAKAAFVAGADLILGHHSHLPKGVEVFDGKACFYGLSNFIMTLHEMTPQKAADFMKRYGQYGAKINPDPAYARLAYGYDGKRSMIAKAVLARDGVKRVSFLPVLIDRHLRPEILRNGDPRFDEMVQYMEWCSEDLNHKFAVEGDEVVVAG